MFKFICDYSRSEVTLFKNSGNYSYHLFQHPTRRDIGRMYLYIPFGSQYKQQTH